MQSRQRWQDETQEKALPRRMRPPEWPHTPADMPSLSAWSVENAERSTVDAHGVKTARNESCGAVSADSPTAKNIAISLLLCQIVGAMEMELTPIPGETMTIAEIDHQLEALNKRFQMLLSKAAEEGADTYTEQFKAIMDKTAALKDKRTTIEAQRKENADANQHIARAVETMQAASAELTEWDEPIIRQLVDTVKVVSVDEIIVYLRGGVEIRQDIIR